MTILRFPEKSALSTLLNNLLDAERMAPTRENLPFGRASIASGYTPRTKAVIQARAKSVNKTVTDYLCLCGLGKEIVQVEGLDKVLPS